MKLTILYNEDNGCDYHRLILPVQQMKLEKGDSITLVRHIDCRMEEQWFDCDILMYSRIFFGDYQLEYLKGLKRKYGFKIVVDFDDSNRVYHSHILYRNWQEHRVEEQMISNAQNADLVIVTNDQLRTIYREFNRNTHVVTNALPIDKDQFKPNSTESDRLRFLYAGGSSHYPDLKSISGLFAKLKSDGEFKKYGKFVLCGYNNKETNRNVWDKMESLCRIPGAYERRDTLKLHEYMQHYNYGDVCIAPLDDNDFNHHKSNLKYLEAGTMHKPFICNNSLPYTVDKELKDKGIKFCHKTTEWHEAFKFFLRNKSAVTDYGETNYEYVKQNYNLENININRLELLKTLL